MNDSPLLTKSDLEFIRQRKLRQANLDFRLDKFCTKLNCKRRVDATHSRCGKHPYKND
jgi:hypothetical protein